jgi:hypothetical protein
MSERMKEILDFENKVTEIFEKVEYIEDPFALANVQHMIAEECNAIRDLLIMKNKEYGNSALQPKRIFSNSNPIEQIKVRIDDKLSRLSTRGEKEIHEDTCSDLMGYLILLKVAQRLYGEE